MADVDDETAHNLTEEVSMNYKPGASLADEGTKGIPPSEYIEDTTKMMNDGPNAGGIYKVDEGLSNDALEEITKEVGETIVKKADGGRIGFARGTPSPSILDILPPDFDDLSTEEFMNLIK